MFSKEIAKSHKILHTKTFGTKRTYVLDSVYYEKEEAERRAKFLKLKSGKTHHLYDEKMKAHYQVSSNSTWYVRVVPVKRDTIPKTINYAVYMANRKIKGV